MPRPVTVLQPGDRYNRLVAMEPRHIQGKHRKWLFRCDCGNEREIHGYKVRAGHTQSCGCLAAQRLREGQNTKHGACRRGFKNHLYMLRHAIIARCENPSHPSFPNYGGRGIRVCAEWKASFEAFAKDVGAKPTRQHSIDRIDNNGHYEPGNVRWATRTEQSRNMRPRGLMKAHDAIVSQLSALA